MTEHPNTIPAPAPRELSASDLRRVADLTDLAFTSTAELGELEGIIGQERATRAVEFGLNIDARGYNIFALGPAGAGRTTTIRRYLEQVAARKKPPDDWVYVYNFDDPDAPKAIRLPAGRAAQLRQRVEELLRDVAQQLPQAFETEQYQEHRSQLVRTFQRMREELLNKVKEFAQSRGFLILETPMGLAIAPMDENRKPMPPDKYEALPQPVRAQYEAAREEVEQVLERAMRQAYEVEKELRKKLAELDKKVAEAVLEYLFDDERREFSDLPEVVAWLDACRADMVKNIHLVRQVLAAAAQMATGEGGGPPVLSLRQWEESPLARYSVNVIVDNSKLQGAPVVYEPNPTVVNLIGKQEYKVRFGALVTDFTMLRAGALHKANGGYLVLNITDVLRQPLAWDVLKRALKTGQVVIEDVPQQMFGFLPTAGLRPEPIPLNVKVVLIGEPIYYYMLYALDEDFAELFKVRADFSPDMPWTREHVEQIARFVHTICQEENLCHFSPEAVYEPNPTVVNLIGKQEYKVRFGALVTDFTMLRAGALHKANGGYLVLNITDVLRQPLAWDVLKRALKTGQVVIEDVPQQMFGFLPTAGLRPEPIPLNVKVVLIGEPIYYYMLYALDEDFAELFKVRADFSPDMPWTREHVEQIARFVHTICQEENLCHFSPEAVAEVVTYAGRLADSKKKLSARFGLIADVVRESAYWATQAGHDVVLAEDVQKAIDERVYRSRMLEERIQELIQDNIIYIDTEGKAVGQVNGLSVIMLGDYTFGRPNRITARVYLGQAGVINIEREAKLSGRIHDKGVLILSGFLAGRYAQDKPLSLSATITFEQSYEGVEGDSASSTELYALMSALSGLPLRQDIAVTGSVNQHGQIQPVGGVNEKIEGFFAVCKARGLTGSQGVIIPEANVQHLMLKPEVIKAVEEGKFHIYPVRTVDEGIQILTGVAAGERQPDGSWPEGTVNYLVDKRLREMAMQLRQFGRRKEEEKKEEEEEEQPKKEPPKEPPTPPDVPEPS